MTGSHFLTMRQRTFRRTPFFKFFFSVALQESMCTTSDFFRCLEVSKDLLNTGKNDMAISKVCKYLPRAKSLGKLKHYASLFTMCTQTLSFKIPSNNNLNFK